MQKITSGLIIIYTLNITKFYNAFTYHPMNLNVK